MQTLFSCFSNKDLREDKPLVEELRPIGMFVVGSVVQDTKYDESKDRYFPINRFGHIAKFQRGKSEPNLHVKVKWENNFDLETVLIKELIFHPS